MSTTQLVSATAPRIQLASMPQLAEAISKEDNWTGTNDAAARRRAQTRLNTRAYRKRKALAKKNQESGAATVILIKQEPQVQCWDIEQQSISLVSASRLKHLYSGKSPLLSNDPKEKSWTNAIFPLCPDHLLTLLQYNVLRALAVNRTLISGILTTPLDCGDEKIHVVPYPTDPARLPPTLLPTALQQTVPHGDWIDVFPCPVARDRLIRAQGAYDEDELWADCIGGLYEGFPDDEVERRGIIAWSPPWDIRGWEASEGFALGKWRWLFQGLPGALEATNGWRMQRGEEAFVYDDEDA
ncbi:hypothetical protein BJ166DRAFT_193552 [Pestalotiopsis sp. NC0098]|nr:hypothetical protein BJ166DRAFT_193552 [Pestalotiopsis sp. NC0098]